MKCRKANTDQSFSLVLQINGNPCTEYTLPPSASNTPPSSNVLQCFVPVSADDKITLDGAFAGTVLHANFDLLADGTFLSDKRIEGEQSGELKYYARRRLKWDAVLNVPKPEDWSSIYDPKRAVEGDLVVKALPSVEEDDGTRVQGVLSQMSEDGTKLGVGSIAVVVSVTQKDGEGYTHDYADTHNGAWKRRDASGVSNAGVDPTHELLVEVTDEMIHTNRQSRHRRHFDQLRFGKKPWVTFVFHYRSHMAIQQAGCVVRPDQEYELSAEDVEGYVMSNPAQRGIRRGTSMRLGKPESTEPNVARTVVDLSPQPSPHPAPLPAKKKLLGQSLFQSRPPPTVRSESPETLFVGQASPEEDEMSIMSDVGRDSPSLRLGGSQRKKSLDVRDLEQAIADEFEKESDRGASAHASHRNKAGVSGHYQGMADELLAGDGIPKEGLLATSRPDAGIPATAQHHNPTMMSENTMRALSKASSRRSHSRTDTPDRTARSEICHDDLRALASADGVVPLHTLAEYCDENRIDQDIGMLRMQEIAFKSGTSYVIPDVRKKSMSRAATPVLAVVERTGAHVVAVGPSASAAGEGMGQESTGTAASVEVNHEGASQSYPLLLTNTRPEQIDTGGAAPVVSAPTVEMGTTTTKIEAERTQGSPADHTVVGNTSITTSATAPTSQGSYPATPSSLKRKVLMDQSPFPREGTPAKKQKSEFESMEEYLAYLKAERVRKQTLIKQAKEEKARKAAEEAEEQKREEEQAREEAERKRREEEAEKKREEEVQRAREEAMQREIDELERLNEEEDEELEALMLD